MDHDGWWAFGQTQSLGLHDQPKLGVAATVQRSEVAAEPGGAALFHNVRVNGPFRGYPDPRLLGPTTRGAPTKPALGRRHPALIPDSQR